jgi:hypothetical protein
MSDSPAQVFVDELHRLDCAVDGTKVLGRRIKYATSERALESATPNEQRWATKIEIPISQLTTAAVEQRHAAMLFHFVQCWKEEPGVYDGLHRTPVLTTLTSDGVLSVIYYTFINKREPAEA